MSGLPQPLSGNFCGLGFNAACYRVASTPRFMPLLYSMLYGKRRINVIMRK
jgi:hypothetical protein